MSDQYDTVSLLDGMKEAGIETNADLTKLYTDYRADRPVAGMWAQDWTLPEVPADQYSDSLISDAKSFSDEAVVVLTRVGGEGADLPMNMKAEGITYENNSKDYEDFKDGESFLQLSQTERDMLDLVTKNFNKVTLVYNGANTFQFDFLNDYPQIKSVVWCPPAGQTGFSALGDVLAGDTSPSGKTSDTFLKDLTQSVSYNNFGKFEYTTWKTRPPSTRASLVTKSPPIPGFVNYSEGIYVGYKYYETRYEDFVTGNGNAGDYAYGDIVAYPFGYGMSYTDFDISDMNSQLQCRRWHLTPSPSRSPTTGDMAGKKTVQVYVQSPYTDYDKENGVEKSAVSLVGFGKTGMIEPGASETLSMTVNKRDIASYDTYGAGTYILDAGDYYFTAATDAHNAVNNILAAKGYTVESTNGKMTADGNADLTYTWTEDALDTTTYATSENGTAITNQLSSADPNLYEGIEETVTWLSRSDWNGTLPTETVKLALTELLKKDLKDIRYDPADYESVDMPTLGAKNGVKLYDMIGLDYNDPKWDELLDQMTFDEMNSLIGDAFHWTMPVKSVEAPGTRDENGPQGLTASLLGNDKSQLTATAFTSEDVMAATFNTEIMTEIGKVIGNNCLEADIACLYGPGNNIHRTPYGGRNFEYYSEDGFLSGKMSAAEVEQIQAKGVHVVMKHLLE